MEQAMDSYSISCKKGLAKSYVFGVSVFAKFTK